LVKALQHEQSVGESSAILIALPGRLNDLQSDPRFRTEPVGQHGNLAALRVRLNPAAVGADESRQSSRTSSNGTARKPGA
jgi:hypothetical protein